MDYQSSREGRATCRSFRLQNYTLLCVYTCQHSVTRTRFQLLADSSAKTITHQLGADTKEAFLRIKLLEWNPTVSEKNMIVMATNTAGLSYDPLRNSQKWRWSLKVGCHHTLRTLLLYPDRFQRSRSGESFVNCYSRCGECCSSGAMMQT